MIKEGLFTDDGSVTSVNTVFSGNTAKVDGGAVYSKGSVNVKHCLFESNKADGASSQCYGGVIRAADAVVIDNCTFKDNYAEDYGGAVYAGWVAVNTNFDNNDFSSFFINNKAGDDKGGAIYSTGSVRIIDSVLSGNKANVDGGAIYAEDNVDVKHCLFESNRAEGASASRCFGGAIRAEEDSTISNSTFNKNYAENRGGAVHASTITLNPYCHFEGNTAGEYGGAIYTDKFDKSVDHVSFIGNKAEEEDGGAIYINSANTLTFSQCNFIDNHCGDEGGAIYLDSMSSSLTLKENIFKGNSAKKEGQAVYNYGKYNEINNNFWCGNNPSSNNDLLVEWKMVGSNAHHSDSDPLKAVLDISSDYQVAKQGYSALYFHKSNGETFMNRLFDLNTVSFNSTPAVIFDDKSVLNCVSMYFTPVVEGTHTITFNIYGYDVSKTIEVSKFSLFGEMEGNNSNPINMDNNVMNSENFLPKTDMAYQNYITAVEINAGAVDDVSKDNGNITNQSSKAPVTKSIDNPQTNSGDNTLWWIILAILAIVAAGGIIKKYKN